MRDLTQLEWFGVFATFIAALLYVLNRLLERTPPNRSPRKDDEFDSFN
jgi:hypothetical protein